MRLIKSIIIVLIILSLFPTVHAQVDCVIVNAGDPQVSECEDDPGCYVGSAGSRVLLCYSEEEEEVVEEVPVVEEIPEEIIEEIPEEIKEQLLTQIMHQNGILEYMAHRG